MEKDMRYFFLLVFAVLTAGCATTAGYEKVLNSWVGRQEIELVRAWGSPLRTYEAGGRKFIAFASKRNLFVAGSPPRYQTTIIGNTAYTDVSGGTPDANIPLSCLTTFEINGSTIVSWHYKGNDCVAKE